ncbi:MAG: four helix bundle protein [Nitrospirota bacterium]|nr:four helix bundle protein [Nitrospirota bacterium]
MAKRFEDLEVWQKAYRVVVEIYKSFSKCKDYSFRGQITRSAVSIPSNIAEGFERNSNKEFIHYLYIAKGSCGELRTQLCIAVEIGYLLKESGRELIKAAEEISYMLNGLIQKRKTF